MAPGGAVSAPRSADARTLDRWPWQLLRRRSGGESYVRVLRERRDFLATVNLEDDCELMAEWTAILTELEEVEKYQHTVGDGGGRGKGPQVPGRRRILTPLSFASDPPSPPSMSPVPSPAVGGVGHHPIFGLAAVVGGAAASQSRRGKGEVSGERGSSPEAGASGAIASHVQLCSLLEVLPDPFGTLTDWPAVKGSMDGARGDFLSDYVDEMPEWESIVTAMLKSPQKPADWVMRHGHLAGEIHSFFSELEWTVHGRAKGSKREFVSPHRTSRSSLRNEHVHFSALQHAGSFKKAHIADLPLQCSALGLALHCAAKGQDVDDGDIHELARDYITETVEHICFMLGIEENVEDDSMQTEIGSSTNSSADFSVAAILSHAKCYQDPMFNSANSSRYNLHDLYQHALFMLTLAHSENVIHFRSRIIDVYKELPPFDPSIPPCTASLHILKQMSQYCSVTELDAAVTTLELVQFGFVHSTRCYSWVSTVISKIAELLLSYTENTSTTSCKFRAAAATSLVLKHVHEALNSFYDIFVSEKGHGDIFSGAPDLDALFKVWRNCCNLQAILNPGIALPEESSTDTLRGCMENSFEKMYYSLLHEHCADHYKTSRLKAGSTEHTMLSADALAQVAEAMPQRVQYICRRFQKTFEPIVDLSVAVVSSFYTRICKDAVEKFLWYVDGDIDLTRAACGDSCTNDRGVVRLAIAIATLCEKWSSHATVSDQSWRVTFSTVLLRVLDNLRDMQLAWMNQAFQFTDWSAGPLAVEILEPNSPIPHNNSVTRYVPIPGCVVDVIFSMCKTVSFAHGMLRLIDPHNHSLKSSVRCTEALERGSHECTLRLCTVVHTVIRDFCLMVLKDCIDTPASEESVRSVYVEFCRLLEGMIEQPGYQDAPLAQVVATERSQPSSPSRNSRRSSPSRLSQGRRSESESPRRYQGGRRSSVAKSTDSSANSDDNDIVEDTLDIRALSIASPLAFSSDEEEAVASVWSMHAVIAMPSPWNILDLDVDVHVVPESVSNAQVGVGASLPSIAPILAEMNSKISSLWQSGDRGELCSRLSSLAACADLMPSLQAYLDKLGLIRPKKSDLQPHQAGCMYVRKLAELGTFCFSGKLFACTKSALTEVASPTCSFGACNPKKEREIFLAVLHTAASYFERELIQTAVILSPNMQTAVARGVLTRIYDTFASAALARGIFYTVAADHADRVRHALAYLHDAFQQIDSVVLDDELGRQFSHLVVHFELYTTPTLDLIYLYLHCCHVISRSSNDFTALSPMSSHLVYRQLRRLRDVSAPACESRWETQPSESFDRVLVAIWSSGIVPRLVESFSGVILTLFRCLQVNRLIQSGELKVDTPQFAMKLMTCRFIATEHLRQWFYRHHLISSRGFLWSCPRSFTGGEFCNALNSAQVPSALEQEALYGGGILERIKLEKHSADELLGVILHGNNIVAVDNGSPAKRAGIQAGDNLIAINDQDLRGLTHDEIVEIMREKGTLRREVFDVGTALVPDGISGNSMNKPTEEFMQAGLEVTLIVERKAIHDLRERPHWSLSQSDAIEIGQMMFENKLLMPVDGATEFGDTKRLYRFAMDNISSSKQVPISKWTPTVCVEDPFLAQGQIAVILSQRAPIDGTALAFTELLKPHTNSPLL